MIMLLKPTPRSYSLQDYVDELTRRIYLMTEADPELRARAAAVLTSHVGGGRESNERAVPRNAKSAETASIAENPAAIPVAQDSPRPETHRVIVRYEREVGGVLRPVYDEHPVGNCANCGADRDPDDEKEGMG